MSTATSESRIHAYPTPVAMLTHRDRADAFDLLGRHFDGVTRDQFERDLAGKNFVLLLRERPTGALIGFSTMRVYETCDPDGSPVSVVCSGDTVVEPTAWNTASLPRHWIAAVRSLRTLYPNGPYYWLLISSGFRTYRLLSTFWNTFYPRFDAPTPPDQQRLLDHLAVERFGDEYDARTGIVRFAKPQVLRPHLAGIPDARWDDPHVAFFARRNPRHADGDELACLCQLTDANLTRAGRRMVYGPEARAE